MARDKWWRRQGHPAQGGRYAPALRPVWLVALIAVVAAIALAGGIYLGLLALAVPHPGPNGGPAVIDPLDVIKTTITVAGFVGAVLVGVYGYRKQRLVEGDAQRADAEQLALRYTTAADQMGHEKAAVRLAGVYAMARLADDWDDQRQVCIDVLCAYLRMPYEPDTASEKHREGEREVRLTVIRIIRCRLRDPSAPTTWCGRDLDFTNATFDGGDFGGAKFTGGTVSFNGAEFTGGTVSFNGAEFTGGNVLFHRTKFTGGEISFFGAKFAGSAVPFHGAEFTGGKASFFHAKFTGGKVFFSDAKLSGGEVNFRWAEFTGGEVFFQLTKFTGGEISFFHTKFSGGEVNFYRAEFTGGVVSFDEATYTNGVVVFENAEFTTGCRIKWGPFEPPAAWTALHGGSGGDA